MSAPSGIERRDPCAPLLRLGAVLAAARREGANGIVEVVEPSRTHAIRVVRGAIAGVDSGPGGDRETVSRRAARLFDLERPRVAFTPLPFASGGGELADPDQVVVAGVRARRDLFDPIRLVERIPVRSLNVRPDKRALVARLGLEDDELELVDALRIPTPTALVLWKRGLEPRRAGALLVALNLVGAFDDWRPGLLPRLVAALRVLERAASGATDRELLAAPPDGDPREEDRAFRKLSLELHPDRLRGLPPEEARMAEEAIRLVNAAYERLKRSRRAPAVRTGEAIGRVRIVRRAPEGWAELLELTRSCLAVGDVPRAKAFALKALALAPPPPARAELLAALTRAA
jgi:hypothetical protein